MGQGQIPSVLFPLRVLTPEIPEWGSKRSGTHLGTLSGQSSCWGLLEHSHGCKEIQRPPKAWQGDSCRQDQARIHETQRKRKAGPFFQNILRISRRQEQSVTSEFGALVSTHVAHSCSRPGPQGVWNPTIPACHCQTT